MSDPIPVAAVETGKKTSTIIHDGAEATVSMDMENAQCQWNGQSFNKGERVAADGIVYECSYGCWIRLE